MRLTSRISPLLLPQLAAVVAREWSLLQAVVAPSARTLRAALQHAAFQHGLLHLAVGALLCHLVVSFLLDFFPAGALVQRAVKRRLAQPLGRALGGGRWVLEQESGLAEEPRGPAGLPAAAHRGVGHVQAVLGPRARDVEQSPFLL